MQVVVVAHQPQPEEPVQPPHSPNASQGSVGLSQ